MTYKKSFIVQISISKQPLPTRFTGEKRIIATKYLTQTPAVGKIKVLLPSPFPIVIMYTNDKNQYKHISLTLHRDTIDVVVKLIPDNSKVTSLMVYPFIMSQKFKTSMASMKLTEKTHQKVKKSKFSLKKLVKEACECCNAAQLLNICNRAEEQPPLQEGQVPVQEANKFNFSVLINPSGILFKLPFLHGMQ